MRGCRPSLMNIRLWGGAERRLGSVLIGWGILLQELPPKDGDFLGRVDRDLHYTTLDVSDLDDDVLTDHNLPARLP